MGMDVSGIKPTTKAGEYFRNNVWWWRPLWDYCHHIGEGVITEEMFVSGQHNDGAGLDAPQSGRLAERLRAAIDGGDTEEYSTEHATRLANMPDVVCDICKGEGTRTDVTPVTPRGGPRDCNGCGGKGTRRPFEVHYPFSTQNVELFVDFLEGCGGFEIH